MRTDVPALGHHYAEKEEKKQDSSANPSVGGVRCGFVEVSLVDLQDAMIQPSSRS